MEIEKSDSDYWETDNEQDESPSIEYFRLKISNIHRIKQGLNDIGHLKSKKYKKVVTKEAHEKVKLFNEYFNNSVFPEIRLVDKMYNKNEELNTIKYGNETYHVINKPEVGSNLIFQLGNNSRTPLNFIDVSQTFYEATTKISYVPSTAPLNKPRPKTLRKRKRKIKVEIKQDDKQRLKSKYLVGLTEEEKAKLKNESCNEILSKIRQKDKKIIRKNKKNYKKNCCKINVTVKTNVDELPVVNEIIKEDYNN